MCRKIFLNAGLTTECRPSTPILESKPWDLISWKFEPQYIGSNDDYANICALWSIVFAHVSRDCLRCTVLRKLD